MTINLYIALPWFFLIVFVVGIYLGVKAHQYKLVLDEAGREYERNFNCMGIRKPNPNRPTPPLPLHNPNK